MSNLITLDKLFTVGLIIFSLLVARYAYKNLKAPVKNALGQISETWKKVFKPKKRYYVGEYFGSRWLQWLGEDQSDRKGRPFKGIVISVQYWNFVVRPIVGLLGGIVTSVLFYICIGIGGWFLPAYFILGVIVFAVLPDGNEAVPEARAAMLTFIGRRGRIYRGEGNYNWTGKLFLLGRSSTVKDEGTDQNGFIFVRPFQIKIWNQNDDKKPTIEAQAKNNANVSTTLTLTEQLWDPMLWLDNEDPVLALAERSRESFRGAIRFFTDSDCAGLKNRLGKIMEGWKLVAATLPERNAGGRPYSILRDQAGNMLINTFKPKTGKKVLERAMNDYRVTALTEANSKQLAECLKDVTELPVKVFEVEKALHEVADALGSETLDAAVGNLQLSKPVQEAANQASSEVEQRESQEKSAEAISVAAKKLGDAQKEHGDLAVAIAASADNNDNVRVIVGNSGADPITKAASIIASERR